jgi:hypothetical protein
LQLKKEAPYRNFSKKQLLPSAKREKTAVPKRSHVQYPVILSEAISFSFGFS